MQGHPDTGAWLALAPWGWHSFPHPLLLASVGLSLLLQTLAPASPEGGRETECLNATVRGRGRWAGLGRALIPGLGV